MTLSYAEYKENRAGSQTSFSLLPAVVIGGPPHSGKSVLAYSLTQALRERNVPHYVLRAYPPDCEGDWFLESEAEWVRHLRLKGTRSEAWLEPLQRDVARRHLPLIVDVGGLPTPEQEELLDACTHGILLTPDDEAQRLWRERMERHGLVILADVRSDLHGENALHAETPLIRGTLAGLERGRQAGGPAFDALVERLAARFSAAGQGLRRRHLAAAPPELATDLASLARQLDRDPRNWQPEDLPDVLDYLPARQPLGLYGRGPTWLYAAIAAHALPAPFYLFDVRHGWLRAPALEAGPPLPDAGLHWQLHRKPYGHLIDFRLPDTYLDVEDLADTRIPPRPDSGIVLSGKLPHWLWAALARAYHEAPWVATLYPPLSCAVVVASREPGQPVGARIPFSDLPAS